MLAPSTVDGGAYSWVHGKLQGTNLKFQEINYITIK